MPGGDFHPWLFFIIAAWVLICGLGVVAFKKIMYSAVSMVFCFLGVADAGQQVWLVTATPYELAEIIAKRLGLTGALGTVAEVQDGRYDQFFNRQSIFAVPLAVAAAAVLTVVVAFSEISGVGDKALNPSLRVLSGLLFNRYVFPFELVSLVLIAALIGAIVLARKEEERP